MKHLRKIAALILSCVMVFGMASVVYATGGASSGTTGTGKITINNAIPGQTYTIYRILELESHDKTNEHYAYKATTAWESFLKSDGIKDTYVTIDGEYVTWKEGAKAAEFAKEALQYAKENSTLISNNGEEKATSASGTATTSVKFENLPLGYYLVDSSAGALCSLDTTKPDATIEEKNVVPTVEKKVEEDSKAGTSSAYGDSNTADIGQTVYFQTTITAQAGAENYVLHDKMGAGLTFDGSVTVTITKKTTSETTSETTTVATTDYTLKKSTDSPATITDDCTFELSFKQDFCNTLAADDKITVSYSATLNENAVIGTTGNTNETWLSYGDNQKTLKKTTTTKTYSISVFKYEKVSTSGESTQKGLANAQFTISKNKNGTDRINLVKTSADDALTNIYRVAKTTETGTTTTITTPTTGKFEIKGLDADTYYLTETKQPDGYNKLAAPVKVVIGEDGKLTIGNATKSEAADTQVEIENKTGSLLPSTGGRGTTLFYILGGILVLGSAVVLITKRRMK